MIFDSHAHYDDSKFDGDREQLLPSLAEHGIGPVINVGSSLEGCQKTAALTEQYDFVYGALGIHPSDISDLTEESYQWILQKSQLPKIVAKSALTTTGKKTKPHSGSSATGSAARWNWHGILGCQ